MTKTESDYFFFSTKIKIFFSATLGIRIFFLEINHKPPLEVKWTVPNSSLFLMDLHKFLRKKIE